MSTSQNPQNDDSWTPYRETLRYRRLLLASMLLNLALAAALVYCTR